MPPPKPTIRFCVNNTTSLAEREQLLSAGCEVRDCLGRCSQCFDRRFVAVGKQIIEGDTYDAILEIAQRVMDPNRAGHTNS
ncbi:MAG: hypothetical protein AB8F26_01075 [Phycisphaerales bacterium]